MLLLANMQVTCLLLSEPVVYQLRQFLGALIQDAGGREELMFSAKTGRNDVRIAKVCDSLQVMSQVHPRAVRFAHTL